MNDMVPMGSLAPLPSFDTGGARPTLSRRAKAAIVVRLLLNEGADIPLEDLPDELQEALTHQMGSMRLVDRDTLSAVVAEFADEIESIGLSSPPASRARWMCWTARSAARPHCGCARKRGCANRAIPGPGSRN
jgi:Flagellar motor switch protein